MKPIIKTYRSSNSANGEARSFFGWPSLVIALATPQFRFVPVFFPTGLQARRRIAFGALALSFLAALCYIIAVNAILVAGEGIKSDQREFAALEERRAGLQAKSIRLQSPALLQAAARADGMVDVADVRYLTSDRTVALSR